MSSAAPATRTTLGPIAPLPLRAIAVVNGGLALALACLWVALLVQGSYWRSDFTAFYLGGRMVLDGQGQQLYDLAAQGEYQARLWPERGEHEALLAFVNPPQASLLFAPLALLSRPVAFAVWSATNVGLLVLLVRFVLRFTKDWPSPARWPAIVTVLAFPPLFISFQLGQIALLGLVCLLGFYDALGRGKGWRAAGWFVLGTIKPQLVLVPAMTLLAGRRWRTLGLAAALFGAWALIATAFLGWSCWPAWLRMTEHCSRQFGTYGIHPLSMYNLKGLLTAVLTGERAAVVNALTAATTLASLLVTLWLWRGPWPTEPRRFAQRAGMTLLLGLLANPHLNPADALAYVAPALLLGSALPPGPGRAAHAILAAAVPLLFLLDCYTVAQWPGQVRPFFLLLVAWTVAIVPRVRQPARQALGAHE